mmetsp:Transcript_13724/g.31683  ORF Transcript_13724/g.31683 Transcript_13724/m.31683 type:complete len:216 (-) Transcript_13724:926-1573(-)
MIRPFPRTRAVMEARHEADSDRPVSKMTRSGAIPHRLACEAVRYHTAWSKRRDTSPLDVLEVGDREEGDDAEGHREAHQRQCVAPAVLVDRLRSDAPVVPDSEHCWHAPARPEVRLHPIRSLLVRDLPGDVCHDVAARAPCSLRVEAGEPFWHIQTEARHVVGVLRDTRFRTVELGGHCRLQPEPSGGDVVEELPGPGDRRLGHEEARVEVQDPD